MISRIPASISLLSLPSLHTLTVSELWGSYPNAMAGLDITRACPAMKVLELTGCSLCTSEISAVIQCCPNLSQLHVLWTGDASFALALHQADQESGLQWGVIGNAIAAYAPGLTSLTLCSSYWPRDEVPLGYPFMMGSALRQLEHLRFLRVDYCMLYGCELQELNCSLSEIVPESVWSLAIISSEGGHADLWKECQRNDLNQFLQNPSFRLLCRVGLGLPLENTNSHVCEHTKTKYGWEVTPDGRHTSGDGFEAAQLVNRDRAKANGTQHVLKRHDPVVNSWGWTA